MASRTDGRHARKDRKVERSKGRKVERSKGRKVDVVHNAAKKRNPSLELLFSV